MSLSEPAQALVAVATAFSTAEIPYFLVGSFASGLRGEFRATNDIDLVAKIDQESWPRLKGELADKFVLDEVAIPEIIAQESCFNVLHEPTYFRCDVFTKLGPLEEEELSRASDVNIPDSETSIIASSAEYNILAKLRWYLKSNRVLDRQLRDVRGIIEVHRGNLDVAYLRHWAAKLGLVELLEEFEI